MVHLTLVFWNFNQPFVSVDSASPVTSVQPVAGSPTAFVTSMFVKVIVVS